MAQRTSYSYPRSCLMHDKFTNKKVKGKGKGKVYPITGHEGPEVE